jgi:5'-phosphate synthase pdxT subunit
MISHNELTIGVLALQGDFEAHQKALGRLGVKSCLVRSPSEVEAVDGLILPGGESTTVGKLMLRHGVDRAILERAERGMPIYGTCAGMILLAKEIEDSDQFRLALMDITVARNAFGRQIDSFEADVLLPAISDRPVRGVFIRAPYVTGCAKKCEVLGTYDGKIVAVRESNLLASAFHPELTEDTCVHEYFLKIVRRFAAA